MGVVGKAVLECKYDGCEVSFRSQGEAERHHRIHTGDRPFLCQQCDKSFKRLGCLKRHLAVHADAKPFKCSVCARTFSFKYAANRHESLHRRKAGAKGSQCRKTADTKRSSGKRSLSVTSPPPSNPQPGSAASSALTAVSAVAKAAAAHQRQREPPLSPAAAGDTCRRSGLRVKAADNPISIASLVFHPQHFTCAATGVRLTLRNAVVGTGADGKPDAFLKGHGKHPLAQAAGPSEQQRPRLGGNRDGDDGGAVVMSAAEPPHQPQPPSAAHAQGPGHQNRARPLTPRPAGTQSSDTACRRCGVQVKAMDNPVFIGGLVFHARHFTCGATGVKLKLGTAVLAGDGPARDVYAATALVPAVAYDATLVSVASSLLKLKSPHRCKA